MNKCNTSGVNYTPSNKVHVPSEIVGGFYSLDLGLKIPIERVNDFQYMEDLVKEGKLYKLPTIVESISNESNSIKTNTNNYLATSITSTKTTLNAQYGIDISECDFKKLQGLTNLRVNLFPILANDTMAVTYHKDPTSNEFALGQTVLLAIPQALPIKPDVETSVKIPLYILSDNWKVDTTVDASVTAGISGLVDTLLNITNSTATETSFKMVEMCGACGEIGIDGLVTADFVIEDANGTIMAHSGFTANGNGSYTLTHSALASGDYFLKLGTRSVTHAGTTLNFFADPIKFTI